MNLIIDASIAIKWFIPEIYWEYTVQLQDATEMHAPDFLLLECANVLVKKVRRKELTHDAADEIWDNLLELPVTLYYWQDLLDQARHLACATYRSAYDSLYLVLARQLRGKMVTADRKLYLALNTHPEWSERLLWIEQVTTPPQGL